MGLSYARGSSFSRSKCGNNLKNYGESIRVAIPEFKPVENLQLGGKVLALLALNGFYEARKSDKQFVCVST